MSRHHPNRIRFLALTIASMSTVALGIFVSAAAQAPPSGATMAVAEYPDGSTARALYQLTMNAPVLEGLRAGAQPSEIGALAARDMQAKLPAGYQLKLGETVRVMSRAPRLASTKIVDAETEERRAKLVTLSRIEYKNVPLARGSDFLSIATADGRVLATRQRNLPRSIDATSPTVQDSAAIAAAQSAARSSFGKAKVTASSPVLEIWVDDGQQGHLAWNVMLSSASLEKPQALRYWIAATGSPRVLDAENEIYHTHHGALTGTLWPTTPLRGTASRAIAEATMTRTPGALSTLTGADGRYAYTSGAGSATISSNLSGPNSVVQNMAGAVMTASASGTPASPVDPNFGASVDTDLAQVSAFYWTNLAHDLASDILVSTDLPNLTTRVNVAGSCNAYWNGNSINFFVAGGSCPNMAYSDVVLHEYGHGVDARKGNIVDGGYSEGFGDAMAILGTRQSCLGRDFFGANSCLRPATDVILWPPASGEGVHARGRRYAGFTWELVQQLRNSYSEEEAFRLATELVMAAAAANPSSIPDAVYLSFIADDTDGNLSTCSPHFKELAAAADSRTIPRPANCAESGAGSPGSAGHFPWIPSKKASANSNILQITLHLSQPMEVHVSANTSARSLKGSLPRTFTTGLWNQSAANVMWTNSLRDVTVQNRNQWVNFSTMIGVSLPAGDHTFYWKIWTHGGELEFSGGTMFAEGFVPAARRVAGVLAADAAMDLKRMEVTTVDDRSRRSSAYPAP
jgi:Zn-dependent metalloprotease